ncbi:nitrite reductase small subunit NirD [Bowmanella dokdonensis]|uniref:Nitrite reductase small subunit NirD n=1 Tax=Bowmanella dokdonensis TaxID=751969 RepID=A0A939DR57_9ALTE|nr:nitrite reductase small subunit NirD [Bowmanella dokdonensis]MBN7827270.1 nitrite reductase small subunit NirD [Bowmanella dokdonensis]
MQWNSLCKISDLIDNSGVCAYLEEEEGTGRQLALFKLVLADGGQKLFAIDNWDPIGQANVLSRGIAGSIQGEPVVASPLYKQRFSLVTGRCLDDDSVRVPVYPVRLHEGAVQVANVQLAELEEAC